MVERFEKGKRYIFSVERFEADCGGDWTWHQECDGKEVEVVSEDNGFIGVCEISPCWCVEMGELTMIEKFREWARGGRRSVDIKIESDREFGPETTKTTIFVFDYDLEVGQHVTCPEEIDLEGVKAQREREQYEKLKAKFA